MKNRTVTSVTLGVFLGVVGGVWGFPTLTIVDTVGDPNSINTTAGTSFDVQVRINTDVSMTGLQLRVQETTASPSGLFQLNSVSFNAPTWSSDPGDQYVPALPDLMDGPSYKTDYIADIAGDLVNGTGTGTFSFATLNLTYIGVLLGTYTLNLSDILYGDLNFDEFTDAVSGQDYVVTIIPAPGATLLGMIGLGCVGWLKKRMSCMSAH